MTDSDADVTQAAPESGGGVPDPLAVDDHQSDLVALDHTPRRGDTFTLYSIPQAAPYLGQSADTLRRLIHDGLIPRHFLSRPTPGKTMLSGDAIHALVDWFREVDWAALREPPPPNPTPYRGRWRAS
jgi:excisionase family DNA binding protein